MVRSRLCRLSMRFGPTSIDTCSLPPVLRALPSSFKIWHVRYEVFQSSHSFDTPIHLFTLFSRHYHTPQRLGKRRFADRQRLMPVPERALSTQIQEVPCRLATYVVNNEHKCIIQNSLCRRHKQGGCDAAEQQGTCSDVIGSFGEASQLVRCEIACLVIWLPASLHATPSLSPDVSEQPRAIIFKVRAMTVAV